MYEYCMSRMFQQFLTNFQTRYDIAGFIQQILEGIKKYVKNFSTVFFQIFSTDEFLLLIYFTVFNAINQKSKHDAMRHEL
jgi:hypothetical protein